MNAVDTNILIYHIDSRELKKRPIARKLISRLRREGDSVLVWQVAGEFINQRSRFHRQELIDRN